MEIAIKINKETFDQAVPAARESKGVVFDKLENKINSCIEDIAVDKLGDKGVGAVNNDPAGKLARTVMHLACVDVFLHEMRGLDLVLTGSGFGVVSTNTTAPASKIRVDALDGELRVKWLMLMDDLLEQCFKLDGWYGQGLVVVDSVFCFFRFLTQFAGLNSPLAKDWETAAPVILETDRWLREKISDEFMDELIAQMASVSLTDANRGIVYQVRRIIGVSIQGKKDVAFEYYRRMMNTLEGKLDDFRTYARSQAFEVNHFKPYENRQDEGAFHFVG